MLYFIAMCISSNHLNLTQSSSCTFVHDFFILSFSLVNENGNRIFNFITQPLQRIFRMTLSWHQLKTNSKQQKTGKTHFRVSWLSTILGSLQIFSPLFFLSVLFWRAHGIYLKISKFSFVSWILFPFHLEISFNLNILKANRGRFW